MFKKKTPDKDTKKKFFNNKKIISLVKKTICGVLLFSDTHSLKFSFRSKIRIKFWIFGHFLTYPENKQIYLSSNFLKLLTRKYEIHITKTENKENL
jgi:hypothetical protein